MKNIIWIFVLSFMAFSCNEENGVFIRVDNASQYDFQNLVILDSEIGNLNSGQQSDYTEFERAYSHGFISLDIDTFDLAIFPIDFEGETPLEDGLYTYRIDILDDTNENPSSILLQFIED